MDRHTLALALSLAAMLFVVVLAVSFALSLD